MTEEVQNLAAKIAFQSDEIRGTIDKLIDRQEDLQDDILTLQKRKRDGEAIDQEQLDEFKEAQNEASRMVGILSMQRTELLDDLPVIRTATGKLKIVTAQLEKDADLIEDAKARVDKVTESLQKAENLIVKVIGLIAKV